MNKKYINGVIIVEGHHDVAHISNIYEACFVITNGYDIPQKEINFIKSIPNNVLIIALTDNDEAGEIIRNRLNLIRNDLINIRIPAPNNKKKKGVAEALIKDIEINLDKYVTNKIEEIKYDLYSLGLIGENNSAKMREIIADKFNLGICNKNNMIKRLNILNISIEEIKKAIKDEISK